MSQRLHIGKTDEERYDCVIDSVEDAEKKLIEEWLMYSHGIYFRPFKIRIGDISLFKKIEPIIKKVLENMGETYPDCVWDFYLNDKNITHPDKKELDKWLAT